jgi:hypothetical protein
MHSLGAYRSALGAHGLPVGAYSEHLGAYRSALGAHRLPVGAYSEHLGAYAFVRCL